MAIPPTERLHRTDTYLLDFEAEVVALKPDPGGTLVALDRSAFYVESGGQPGDVGTLAGHEVVELREAEGIVWHRLGGTPDQAGDAGPELAVGARVRGAIDRARRLDHMQQHSGQHILSAACVQVGAGDTVSFHLGREESTIDLAGAEPTRARMSGALALANGCVLDDREFRIHEIERADLARYPVRKDPGLVHDILRLVEIDGFDWSLCGGTHARRAGEVGTVHILGWEKSKANWRVRFLVGRRALAYLDAAHELLDTTARAHSIHWQAIPETMRGWREQNLELLKEVRRLRLERGEREGERLFAATAPDADSIRRLGLWLGTTSMEEARAAVNRFVALGPSLVLAGGQEEGRAYWMAARSDALPEPATSWKAGVILRTWLEGQRGKGGGNDRFAQGSAPLPLDEAALPRLLGEALRG